MKSNKEEEIIIEIVYEALDNLIENDEFLIINDVSEWSVSHKLANYLERFFQPDCVDIEYNKIGNKKNKKQLEEFRDFIFKSNWVEINKELISKYHNFQEETLEVFYKKMEKIYDSKKNNKKVRPDIIVHKRGFEQDNLLVLEIKKESDSLENLYDIVKLYHYKNQLGYKYAAFIQYSYKDEKIAISIHWIKQDPVNNKIKYDYEEDYYENIMNDEIKKTEKLLKKLEDIAEDIHIKFKDNPEASLIMMSSIIDKQSPIKHDVFSDAITKLENKIGKLPIYEVADKLPDEHKKYRYEFLLNEIMTYSFDTLSIIQNHQFDFIKNKIDLLKNDKNSHYIIHEYLNEETFLLREVQQIVKSDINFLQAYCNDFEIIYRNFVYPIYEYLKNNDLLDKLERKEDESNTGLYIRLVIQFLSKDPNLNPLLFLMENLNAEIRNAIVHLNYYISKKELIYYYLPKLPNNIKRIDFQSLIMTYFKLVTARLIWFVSIGKRLEIRKKSKPS